MQPVTPSVAEIARTQASRRASLEAQLLDLEKRQDLAKRRLAGYAADQTGNQTLWLGTPSQIIAMKQRLQKACTDDDELMALVKDVREKREALTDQALNHYAERVAL